MKQMISVILLLCFCMAANAQKIKKMEYFFDTDPGVGKAKPLTITASDTVRVTAALPATNLATGLHTLYVRAKTDTSWGLTESFLFTVSDSSLAKPLTREEYFFDTDPGVGKGVQLSVVAADTLRFSQTLPIGSLTEGLHTLYVRVGNNSGYYSLTENALFYVTAFAANAPKIAGAEYFIDTDPGAGKGKKLTVSSPSDTLRTAYNITLPAGLDTAVNHYLCIRVKDAKGAWGLYGLDTFTVKTAANFASLQMNAEKNGNAADITWNTYNSNAVSYTVEKSADGIDFTELTGITATSTIHEYNITDRALVNGVNFYRIKQISADGSASYSRIVPVLSDKTKTGVFIYPNPAKDMVNIRFATTGKLTLINIFDAAGRRVKMFTLPASQIISINVSGLTAGTYLLHISNGGKVCTGKLIMR